MIGGRFFRGFWIPKKLSGSKKRERRLLWEIKESECHSVKKQVVKS